MAYQPTQQYSRRDLLKGALEVLRTASMATTALALKPLDVLAAELYNHKAPYSPEHLGVVTVFYADVEQKRHPVTALFDAVTARGRSIDIITDIFTNTPENMARILMRGVEVEVLKKKVVGGKEAIAKDIAFYTFEEFMRQYGNLHVGISSREIGTSYLTDTINVENPPGKVVVAATVLVKKENQKTSHYATPGGTAFFGGGGLKVIDVEKEDDAGGGGGGSGGGGGGGGGAGGS